MRDSPHFAAALVTLAKARYDLVLSSADLMGW
jgi:hypothetical protein